MASSKELQLLTILLALIFPILASTDRHFRAAPKHPTRKRAAKSLTPNYDQLSIYFADGRSLAASTVR